MMYVSVVWSVCVAVLGSALVAAAPVPDTSEKCLSCEAKVTQLESLWTNATRYVS